MKLLSLQILGVGFMITGSWVPSATCQSTGADAGLMAVGFLTVVIGFLLSIIFN